MEFAVFPPCDIHFFKDESCEVSAGETLSACWLSHPFVCLQRVPEGAFRITVEKSCIYINIPYIQLTSSFRECMSPRNTVDASELWGGFIPVWKEISARNHLSFFWSSLKRVRLFTRCPRKFQAQIFESLYLWVIFTLGYNYINIKSIYPYIQGIKSTSTCNPFQLNKT